MVELKVVMIMTSLKTAGITEPRIRRLSIKGFVQERVREIRIRRHVRSYGVFGKFTNKKKRPMLWFLIKIREKRRNRIKYACPNRVHKRKQTVKGHESGDAWSLVAWKMPPFPSSSEDYCALGDKVEEKAILSIFRFFFFFVSENGRVGCGWKGGMVRSYLDKSMCSAGSILRVASSKTWPNIPVLDWLWIKAVASDSEMCCECCFCCFPGVNRTRRARTWKRGPRAQRWEWEWEWESGNRKDGKKESQEQKERRKERKRKDCCRVVKRLSTFICMRLSRPSFPPTLLSLVVLCRGT